MDLLMYEENQGQEYKDHTRKKGYLQHSGLGFLKRGTPNTGRVMVTVPLTCHLTT